LRSTPPTYATHPSCWPPHFAVAPVTDCSVLDTWLSPLPADCSAFHFSPPRAAHRFDSARNTWRLASLADCSALDSLRLCCRRITPPHGLLRVQHLELLPAYGLLRTRCLYSSPLADCSALDPLHFTPCSDCSALDAWPSVPVYGLLRTLTLCARVPVPDRSVLDT